MVQTNFRKRLVLQLQLLELRKLSPPSYSSQRRELPLINTQDKCFTGKHFSGPGKHLLGSPTHESAKPCYQRWIRASKLGYFRVGRAGRRRRAPAGSECQTRGRRKYFEIRGWQHYSSYRFSIRFDCCVMADVARNDNSRSSR